MIISFFAQKLGDYLSKTIISNIVHWNSCPEYFVLIDFPIKSKNNHVKYTEHGLFKSSKFSSMINFQSLKRH